MRRHAAPVLVSALVLLVVLACACASKTQPSMAASPPPPGRTGTAPVTDYDSPPKALKITRPQYPQEAYAKKVEGTVIVEILIDSTGKVVRARVIQSVPMLDAAALMTAYRWIFQPAIKNGKPVPVIAHAPVAFRIY